VRGADIVRLVALAAIWSASFIFLRTLSPVLGPVLTATSRVVIAGAALVVYLRLRGVDAGLSRHWRVLVVIGVVNSALPFLLYAFAAVHLPASYSVILNTATPLFAALLSALWLDEPRDRRRRTRCSAGRSPRASAPRCAMRWRAST
jgi:drug/metabolite transporter (DMT)-like permease